MLSLRRRRPLVIAIVSIIFIAAAVVWWVVSYQTSEQSGSKQAQAKTLASPFGLSVEVDPTLAISEQATKVEANGTLWQIDSPAGVSTFRITADYEQGEGIKKLVAASKKSPRDAMTDNLNRQLPQAYPGYKLIGKRQLSQHGSEGLEVNFTYDSNGQKVRQRLLLLVKDDMAAAYIRGQALESTFDSVNGRYFTPLFDSAQFK